MVPLYLQGVTGEAAHASIKGPGTWDVKNFVSAVQSLVSQSLPILFIIRSGVGIVLRRTAVILMHVRYIHVHGVYVHVHVHVYLVVVPD